MAENNYLLDANAILRYLLQDNEEQFHYILKFVKNKNCYITLEVLAEVCYVLESVYLVPRKDIADNFRKLNKDMAILNADVLLAALEIFDKTPKLDFVDCLLYGYKLERGINIITFDKKLKKKLETIKI